ncbi:MAG: outer membrane beta-barrel family protein [Vicingaceae bacterium]
MLISIHAFPQAKSGSQLSISGKVYDPEGEIVPFANVALYKSADSSLYSGKATDMQGSFTIKALPANYYLRITFLSYEPKTIGNLQLEEGDINLGRINLQANSQLLDEVEVTAERSQMELKLDKRVFNIEKDLSNAGANAAEILNNIPSVQVDVEGNISLRGSENVRVLIDGKPSTITAGSVGEALRQFQGNMIESVEVITNPSSRYDAEGEVGIINIILKKEKKKGINGSVEAVAGYPENFRGSFNLNYRTKGFNLFTSVGSSYRKSPGGGSTYQTFNSPDTAYIYEIDNDRERGGISNNFRLGSDIFLNDKNTITVAGFYRFSDEENTAELVYKDLFADGELYRRVDREDIEDEDGENLESSINYTKTFDKKDQKFTVDLQWSERDDLEKSNITEIDNLSGDVLLQKSSNLEYNRTYLVQSDYVHPIGKDGMFESGFRATLRTVENDFQVRESDNGSGFTILDDFNNNFIYKEDIYAGYMMYGNKKGAFSYQLGLRAEYSDIGTELKRTEKTNNWEYLNFFPSAHFTYKLKNKDDFQLSYSRRINRPRFRHLLPFSNFTDARNFWAGNPDLQPEYTNSYELGYLKYFEKGSVFSSIYYRHRTGVIDRITTTNQEGITVRLPVNLATEHNVGYELNGSYDINKKNRINANFNFYRSESTGEYEGEKLENMTFTWNSRVVYRSEILPKVDGQMSFNYRAPRETNQGRNKSLYSIDLSFSKDVMQGKGTLVASVRDLLNSRKYRGITDTEYLYRETEFQWRARQFLLSFTYRINKKKSRGGNRGEYDGGDDF